MPIKSFSRGEMSQEVKKHLLEHKINIRDVNFDTFDFLSERSALSYMEHHSSARLPLITISVKPIEKYAAIIAEYELAETDYFETIRSASFQLTALHAHERLIISKAQSKKITSIKCNSCKGRIPTSILSSLECPICKSKTFLTTPTTEDKIQKYFADSKDIAIKIFNKAKRLDNISKALIKKSETDGLTITYLHHTNF